MIVSFRKLAKLKLTLFTIFLLSVIQGCVSIPREAPELSAELGKRITAFEGAHITLLHKFMDERRTRVDDFITREWIPTFAEKLFPKIKVQWETVCNTGNNEDRLKLLTMLGSKIQKKINDKREELISPLDDLEKEIERKLRREYFQVKAINNTITSFLLSAAKVAENRDRFLNMLGIDDNKISDALTKADKAVSALKSDIKDKEEKVDNFVKSVKDIIDEIK